MYPYVQFFEPEEIGYTEEMKQELLRVATCEEVEARYQNYVSEISGYENQLRFFGRTKVDGMTADDYSITGEMRRLIQPQHSVYAATFIKFLPNSWIEPHVDDRLERSTCLTFPLAPEPPDYVATYYFGEDNVAHKVEWDGRPGALNTRITHAVFNKSKARYSFQLCFCYPIEEFMELHHRGEIFNARVHA